MVINQYKFILQFQKKPSIPSEIVSLLTFPLLLPFDEIPADVADCHGRGNSREFCLNLQS